MIQISVIVTLLYEVSVLLGYDTVSLDNWSQTFRDNVVV